MKKFLSCIALVLIAGFMQAASISDFECDDFYSLSPNSALSDEFQSDSEKSTISGSGQEEYDDDFEEDLGEDLSVEEAELPGVSVFQEIPVRVQNNTGKNISILPDSWDIENIDLYKNFILDPKRVFLLRKKDVNFAYEERLKDRDFKSPYENSGIGPVLIVVYGDSIKNARGDFKHRCEADFIGYIGTYQNAFLSFESTKKYYYEGIDSQKDLFENGLPYPYINSKDCKHSKDDKYLYPFYPLKMRIVPKILDSLLNYELFIHRVKTKIRRNEKSFVHVVEWLDIQEIK